MSRIMVGLVVFVSTDKNRNVHRRCVLLRRFFQDRGKKNLIKRIFFIPQGVGTPHKALCAIFERPNAQSNDKNRLKIF